MPAATATASPTDAVEQMQYLTFQLAGEEYAIGILRVREIIEYDVVTTVPTAPPHIRGVINLRGSVVPVVDLAVKFGLPATTVTKRTCIVIVEAELDGDRTVMGVIADAVSQVVDLPPGDIEPPPSFGTRVRVEHLVGLGRMGRKFALILDIDRLLSARELVAAADMAATDADAARSAAAAA
jgi:purine-binding chemotaxis protein CheW